MKDDQTILLIGAAVAAYFLFMKKKPVTRPRGTVIVEDSRHVEFLPKKQRAGIVKSVDSLNLNPILDKEEYFKTRYKESLNACSY